MPTSCCIKGCTNRHTKGCNLGFFRLPTEAPRRNTWLSIIGEKVTNPSDSSRICGTHFVSGRPSQDPDSIDFVPTLFSTSASTTTTTSVSDAQRVQAHPTNPSHFTGNDHHQSRHQNGRLPSQQSNSYQEDQRRRTARYVSSSWHAQHGDNLKRSGSYDDADDGGSPLYSVARKCPRSQDANDSNCSSNGCSNGLSPKQRSSPPQMISDSTSSKSRLFFPRDVYEVVSELDSKPDFHRSGSFRSTQGVAAILETNQHSGVNESSSYEFSIRRSRITPPTTNGHSDIYSTSSSASMRVQRRDDDCRQSHSPEAVSVLDERATNFEVVEENFLLRKRIRFLDSVVSELKAQLSDQKVYIDRLQHVSRIINDRSPNGKVPPLEPVNGHQRTSS